MREYVARVQALPAFPLADMWLPSKGHSLRARPDYFPGIVPEKDGPTLTSGRRDRLRHTLVRHGVGVGVGWGGMCDSHILTIASMVDSY